MNSTGRNGSHGGGEGVLARLSDRRAGELAPAIAVVALLMLVGLAGNALVCLVFGLRLKSSTQNSLILTLAVFDLLSCLVAMPAEIVDMRFYYSFPSDVACKLLRFVTHFATIGSNLVLVFIAIDRYRKVCRPLSPQMSPSGVKAAIGVTTLAALVVAAPSCVIYGLRSAPAEEGGGEVEGRDCSVSDGVIDTLVPLLYNAALFLCFVLLTLVLVALYALVWREARRHRQYMKEHTTLAMVGSEPRGSVASTRSSLSFVAHSDAAVASEAGEHNPAQDGEDDPHHRTQDGGAPDRTQVRLSPSGAGASKPPYSPRKDKTTLIAFSVTSVFVASLLPHLALQLARIFAKNFDHALQGAALVAYNLFLRSYFVNSAANPVIYGLMNFRFRQESLRLLAFLCCCRTREVWNANRVSSNG